MNDIRELSIDQIVEPLNAMRSEINRDDVFDLAADIKQNGLINPITVRPVYFCRSHSLPIGKHICEGAIVGSEIRYEVVAGHRRLLAHRYGGIAKIKCIVRELDDAKAFAVMTSENLVREDVNPVDEAIHVGRLLEKFGGDIKRVCEIARKGAGWVGDRVAISQMPDDLRIALRDGKLKIGVALALFKIKDDIDRGTCLQTALTHGASVVMANYYAAQWEAGLFGHATGQATPDENSPDRVPSVVKLRCAIDDREYPASDFVTFLVYRENAKYIVAMREHLKQETPETDMSGGGFRKECAEGR